MWTSHRDKKSNGQTAGYDQQINLILNNGCTKWMVICYYLEQHFTIKGILMMEYK